MNIITNIKLSKHKLIASICAMFLLVFIALSISVGNAHAQDMTQVPDNIKQWLANFDGTRFTQGNKNNNNQWDCYLNGNHKGARYAQAEQSWLYNVANGVPDPSADGSSSNPIQVTSGQKLTLGIANLTFYCHNALNGDPVYLGDNNAADGTGDTENEISENPINSPPWTSSGIYFSSETKYQFGSPTVTNNQGSVPNQTINNGTAVTTSFDQGTLNTRYWFPGNFYKKSNSYFTYIAPTVNSSTPTTVKATIQIPIYEANYFNECNSGVCGPNSPRYICVDGAIPIDPNKYKNGDISGGCSENDVKFDIYLNVQPNQPNTVNISGAVFGYNGSSSYILGKDAGVKVLQIYTLNCSQNNPGGLKKVDFNKGTFSFSVATNSVFCIKVAGVPGVDTAVIDPNDNRGPPDASPPSPAQTCGPNGVKGYYPAQEAGVQANMCANADGYVILIEPAAQITCTISANATPNPAPIGLPIASNEKLKLVGTVTPKWKPGTWGYGSIGATESATFNGNTYQLNSPPYNYTLNNTNLPTVSGVYQITAQADTTGLENNVSASCPATSLTLDYQPFISVNGGDVESGLDSRYPSSCISNPGGGIYGWNDDTTGANNFGAGTSESALAAGTITKFISGQGMNFNSTDPLTFANSGPPADGGSFGTTCGSTAETYYSSIPSSDYVSCNLTPSNAAHYVASAENGKGALVFKPGDAPYICKAGASGVIRITTNIIYSGITNTTLPTNLPEVVAINPNGDIDIASDVVHLAGTYIAQSGTIYDTTNFQVKEPPANYSSNNIGANDSPLEIDGVFIANHLDFYRDYGSLNDNSLNSAAERFYYSPLNWLIPGTSSTTRPVTSVTSLPPVL